MSALRATTTGGSVTANASASITKPTGAATGDTVIFAIIASAHTGTGPAAIGALTGWTDTGDVAGGNTDFHFRGFARVLDGTETWPLTVTNTSSVHAWACADYSGASGWDSVSMPAPVYSSTGTTTAGNAVTLANSGDWLTQFVMFGRDSASTAVSLTTPATGFTQQAASSTFSVTSSSLAQATFTDDETAQASGTFTPSTVTISSSGCPRFIWTLGVILGTSGSATLTVPGMTMAAPALTALATAQAIPLTVPGMTLAAPVINPQATAQVVALTTPNMTLAAPLVSIGRGVNLTTPNMALAAPVLNPQPTAQVVTLTAPQMTFAAPTVTLGVSTNLALTTAHMTFSALPLNPLAFIPTYNNPWYGNQLSPLEADFEGPNVP